MTPWLLKHEFYRCVHVFKDNLHNVYYLHFVPWLSLLGYINIHVIILIKHRNNTCRAFLYYSKYKRISSNALLQVHIDAYLIFMLQKSPTINKHGSMESMGAGKKG